MGIFSFFEQIGNFITAIVDMIAFSIQTIKNFVVMVVSTFTYLNAFIIYLPGEIAVCFSVLLGVAIVYLVLSIIP